MALWGVDAAISEDKPKWLPVEDGGVGRKENCFATNDGWVLRHYKKADESEYWDEILCSVSQLAGSQTVTDKLDEATITAVYFSDPVSGAAGGTITVVYNEQVNVTNGATIAVTSDASNFNATAAAQTGVNKVEFTIAASDVAQGDELQIADQTISGTIVDALDTARASDKAIDISVDGRGAGGTGAYATVTVAA
tara:strand:+ start:1560 stop:2144 length:585 start_codon:yes stop_codon:yes gene_type:complete